MTMSNLFVPDDDAVVRPESHNSYFFPSQMFKVSDFWQSLRDRWSYYYGILEEGTTVEVLEPGKKWKRYKLQIRIEFTPVPDAEPEPDSAVEGGEEQKGEESL